MPPFQPRARHAHVASAAGADHALPVQRLHDGRAAVRVYAQLRHRAGLARLRAQKARLPAVAHAHVRAPPGDKQPRARKRVAKNQRRRLIHVIRHGFRLPRPFSLFYHTTKRRPIQPSAAILPRFPHKNPKSTPRKKRPPKRPFSPRINLRKFQNTRLPCESKMVK